MKYVFDSREVPWHEPPGHFSGFSKFLVNDETHNSKYFDFRISRYPIKGLVEPHTHDVAEQIYYVVSGTGMVQVEDQKTLVHPGYTLFFPPGVVHGIENTGDEDLVFFVVSAPPGDVPRN